MLEYNDVAEISREVDDRIFVVQEGFIPESFFSGSMNDVEAIFYAGERIE